LDFCDKEVKEELLISFSMNSTLSAEIRTMSEIKHPFLNQNPAGASLLFEEGTEGHISWNAQAGR